MKNVKYTLKEAMHASGEFDFGEDTCCVKSYIQKRMQSNYISKIKNMERQDISPAFYSLFHHYQITTTSVEKSFSMLRKLLAKDRKFTVENVKEYMILNFSSCAR